MCLKSIGFSIEIKWTETGQLNVSQYRSNSCDSFPG